jgi:DNA-binding NarL/FixJ family response regulator
MDNKTKILVVEDDPIIASGIELELKSFGFENIIKAHDARLALELFQNEKPDFAFLDINLGDGIDGIALAKNLKGKDSNFPIVFITAAGDANTIREAIEAEPDGYLVKPYKTADLLAVVHVIMKKRENLPQEFNQQVDDLYSIIKTKRTEMKLTQAQAAEALDMNYRHYQDLETGKVDPKLTTLKRLIAFYNIK